METHQPLSRWSPYHLHRIIVSEIEHLFWVSWVWWWCIDKQGRSTPSFFIWQGEASKSSMCQLNHLNQLSANWITWINWICPLVYHWCHFCHSAHCACLSASASSVPWEIFKRQQNIEGLSQWVSDCCQSHIWQIATNSWTLVCVPSAWVGWSSDSMVV